MWHVFIGVFVEFRCLIILYWCPLYCLRKYQPVMDGLEATRIIRASSGPNAETPIVFVTATASDDVSHPTEAWGRRTNAQYIYTAGGGLLVIAVTDGSFIPRTRTACP